MEPLLQVVDGVLSMDDLRYILRHGGGSGSEWQDALRSVRIPPVSEAMTGAVTKSPDFSPLEDSLLEAAAARARRSGTLQRIKWDTAQLYFTAYARFALLLQLHSRPRYRRRDQPRHCPFGSVRTQHGEGGSSRARDSEGSFFTFAMQFNC